MKQLLLVVLMAFVSQLSWATPTAEQPDRNIDAYNLLDGSVGLLGFDPVSYFEQGEPLEGDINIKGEYGGVVYHFASEENKVIFFANPTKFEPTYGGFCAWAMAHNQDVNINPTVYTIHGDRIHFFLGQGPKFQFDQDVQKYEDLADINWKDNFSGEEPRNKPAQ